MKNSYWMAAGLVVIAIIWVGSGLFAKDQPVETQMAAAKAAALPTVQVRALSAESHDRRLVLTGRSKASRKIVIKAETSGVVDQVLADEGQRIEAGKALVQLDMAARQSRLAEAQSLLAERQLAYDAAQKLSTKQFTSRTGLASALAQRDAALAAVEQSRLEIAHTHIAAPFAGVLERRHVEQGDFLETGSPVATVLALDPIVLVASVSETVVDEIKVGSSARATTLSGLVVSGRVSFVAVTADPVTRTFRVEVTTANADLALRDGMTVKLEFSLGEVSAHRLSPSVLTLDDQGRIGVKVVSSGDVVRFYPVQLVDQTSDGVWLSGLPTDALVITVGQEFVRVGQEVKPMITPEESGS